MSIEDEVCSFEYAKKLKELGVKQESYFYWSLQESDFIIQHMAKSWASDYSAFTVSELGKLLPFTVKIDGLTCYCGAIVGYTDHEYKGHIDYHYCDEDVSNICVVKKDFSDTTEANARAQTLIYLLENGLIKNES